MMFMMAHAKPGRVKLLVVAAIAMIGIGAGVMFL
jgi:hypothetical protein